MTEEETAGQCCKRISPLDLIRRPLLILRLCCSVLVARTRGSPRSSSNLGRHRIVGPVQAWENCWDVDIMETGGELLNGALWGSILFTGAFLS